MSFYKWTNAGVMNWSTGNTIDATNFNGNWQAIPPIGSIIAWAKSLTGTPSLAEGWIECNGQAITDSDSPYNGLTAPSLNSTNRFLRGSTTSGTESGAENHIHKWTDVGVSGSAFGFTAADKDALTYDSAGSTNDNSISTWRACYTDSQSSLPTHYEVVWILRIK